MDWTLHNNYQSQVMWIRTLKQPTYPTYLYQHIETGQIGIIIFLETIRETSATTVQYYHTIQVLPCPQELHP